MTLEEKILTSYWPFDLKLKDEKSFRIVAIREDLDGLTHHSV